MKKIIVLVCILLGSLSAFSQVKISISDMSLKKKGQEAFRSYADIITLDIKNPYIKIEANVLNDSLEPFEIKTYHTYGVFEIKYQYEGITYCSSCDIQNPIYRMDGILSVPPGESMKLYLVTSIDGLQSDDYISNFIEIFPTITVKFVEEDMNKLLISSEPIEFHSISVKSDSQE